MKALPLWQPWAQLVAIGAKRIETRHWPAPQYLIGQRIAIHATKTRRELWVCDAEPFKRRLGDADLWFGAIVATAVLLRCSAMTEERIAATRRLDPDEVAFGLWQPGRYAWALADVRALAEPVPFTGRQGIFDVPDELLGYEPAQGVLGCLTP